MAGIRRSCRRSSSTCLTQTPRSAIIEQDCRQYKRFENPEFHIVWVTTVLSLFCRWRSTRLVIARHTLGGAIPTRAYSFAVSMAFRHPVIILHLSLWAGSSFLARVRRSSAHGHAYSAQNSWVWGLWFLGFQPLHQACCLNESVRSSLLPSWRRCHSVSDPCHCGPIIPGKLMWLQKWMRLQLKCTPKCIGILDLNTLLEVS